MEKVSARLEETGNGNWCIDGAAAWKGRWLLQGTSFFDFFWNNPWMWLILDRQWYMYDICFKFGSTFLVHGTWYIGIPCTSVHRHVIWLQSCNLLFWVESLKAWIWEWQEHYHLNLFYTMYNDSYKFQYEMKKARSSGGRRHGLERSEL